MGQTNSKSMDHKQSDMKKLDIHTNLLSRASSDRARTIIEAKNSEDNRAMNREEKIKKAHSMIRADRRSLRIRYFLIKIQNTMVSQIK